MTPDAQQPEHCEHECVCPDYNVSNDETEENPCHLSCIHDTRARPHTPAPEIDHRTGDSRVYRKIRPEEEQRIARAATLATLDKLQAWRIRRMNGMLKKDVWKGWNEETDFIESLRRTAQEQQR
jgi:hypothetical protein